MILIPSLRCYLDQNLEWNVKRISGLKSFLLKIQLPQSFSQFLEKLGTYYSDPLLHFTDDLLIFGLILRSYGLL